MSIEGQGHFFTIYFPGFVILCFTRPRYQVSVYRTIGPLVCSHRLIMGKEEIDNFFLSHWGYFEFSFYRDVY